MARVVLEAPLVEGKELPIVEKIEVIVEDGRLGIKSVECVVIPQVCVEVIGKIIRRYVDGEPGSRTRRYIVHAVDIIGAELPTVPPGPEGQGPGAQLDAVRPLPATAAATEIILDPVSPITAVSADGRAAFKMAVSEDRVTVVTGINGAAVAPTAPATVKPGGVACHSGIAWLAVAPDDPAISKEAILDRGRAVEDIDHATILVDTGAPILYSGNRIQRPSGRPLNGIPEAAVADRGRTATNVDLTVLEAQAFDHRVGGADEDLIVHERGVLHIILRILRDQADASAEGEGIGIDRDVP